MADTPESPERLYSPVGTGVDESADGSVLKEGDDLSTGALTTLGDYLSAVTEKNAYSVKATVSVDDAVPASEVEASEIENVFANTFLEGAEPNAKSYFNLLSAGGSPSKPATKEAAGVYSAGGGALGDIESLYSKSGEASDYTGNNLLTDGVGPGQTELTKMGARLPPDSSSDVGAKVSACLKFNRFTPGGDSPYIDSGGYSNGIWTAQKELGVYDPDASAVSLKDLAQVGLSLMLRSVDKDPATPKDATKTNQMFGGFGLALQLERITDLGSLTAAQVSKDLKLGAVANPDEKIIDIGTELAGTSANSVFYPGGGAGAETDSNGQYSVKSYGVLNSYMEPFDGPLPLSMIVLGVLAALATLVAGLVVAVLILLIELIASIGGSTANGTPDSPMPLGSSDPDAPDFGKSNWSKMVKDLMGIRARQSGKNIFLCMIFGVITFYVPRVFGMSAGYYVVVSRQAIRDLDQITEAFKSFPSDPMGIIEGIFILIEAFVTSATYKFCLTMASLGDMCYMSGGPFGKGAYPLSPDQGNIEDMLPTLSNAMMKSRLYMPGDSNNTGKLAWSNSNLPSLLTIGMNHMAAVSKFGKNPFLKQTKSLPMMPGAASPQEGGSLSSMGVTTTGRFSEETVRMYETALDMTYMPFYFQDLRTNEFIAFHAFVSSISDSYSPKWSATSGFGRMDPVQTYESTTRSIGVTFNIVATSKEDFDNQWLHINRLVNLVYPQWSGGMKRKDASGNEFIQPFSQVPTASPLVRFRLGDLFKSNYSKPGLTRLFGVGTSNNAMFKLASDTFEELSHEEIVEELDKIGDRAYGQGGVLKDIDPLTAQILNAAAMAGDLALTAAIASISEPSGFFPGDFVQLRPKGGQTWFAKAGDLPGVYKKMLKKFYPQEGIPCKVIGYIVKPVVDMSSDNEKKKGRQRAKQTVAYVVEPTNEEHKVGPMASGKSVGWITSRLNLSLDLKPTYIAIQEGLYNPPAPIPNPLAPPPDPYVGASEEYKAFFDPANNAVIKSFESTMGQGIAGVITQLDFNWNDSTWEIEKDSRAPIAGVVTLGFAPIHDIPMGLDQQGSMRAPAYPVGETNEQYFGASSPYGMPSAEEMADRIKQKTAALKAAEDMAEAEEDPDEGSTGLD